LYSNADGKWNRHVVLDVITNAVRVRQLVEHTEFVHYGDDDADYDIECGRQCERHAVVISNGVGHEHDHVFSDSHPIEHAVEYTDEQRHSNGDGDGDGHADGQFDEQ
jgi:hypothetical protein